MDNKNKVFHYAHNSFQHELGYPIDPGMIFRQTPEGQPTLPKIIGVGSIIATNYGWVTQYIVKSISEINVMGYKTHSLICKDKHDGSDGYLNEYVAVDGKILSLFGNNDNEIHIHSGGQLALF